MLKGLLKEILKGVLITSITKFLSIFLKEKLKIVNLSTSLPGYVDDFKYVNLNILAVQRELFHMERKDDKILEIKNKFDKPHQAKYTKEYSQSKAKIF